MIFNGIENESFFNDKGSKSFLQYKKVGETREEFSKAPR